MKAQPLKLSDGQYVMATPAEATHLKIALPGSIPERIIPVIASGCRANSPNWSWNGCIDKPTLRPSILTKTYHGDTIKDICHSWITDGQVQFLADSTHSLAGTTAELAELD